MIPTASASKLHHDNLVAQPGLEPAPSYSTLRRFMRANGLDKRRRLAPRQTEGVERAEARIVEREVRRYEAEYVNGLWHWDCHHGSRKVLTARGEWVTPILFGVLDDRSRLACHLQWYLSETAEVVAHGLAQAFQKRGLPRAALSDNGSAMTAAEISEGLARLGILHYTTLPYSPYQYVVQPDMWRRSGSSAVLGGTDGFCATYLRGYSKRRNSMTSGRRDQPPDVLRVRP